MSERERRLRRTGVVIVTIIAAVAVNLLVYGIGAAAGATYRFTSATGPAQVDALTITGFTALPLLIGMTVVAILSRRWRWAILVALVVAPLAAVGSIPFMPLAVDLDTDHPRYRRHRGEKKPQRRSGREAERG